MPDEDMHHVEYDMARMFDSLDGLEARTALKIQSRCRPMSCTLASPIHNIFQRCEADLVPDRHDSICELLRTRFTFGNSVLCTAEGPAICNSYGHFRGDSLLENIDGLHDVSIQLGLGRGLIQLYRQKTVHTTEGTQVRDAYFAERNFVRMFQVAEAAPSTSVSLGILCRQRDIRWLGL